MRIAYLAEPTTGNGFYRGIGPMMALEARGHTVIRLPLDERRPPVAQLQGVDVLHVHRFCDERTQLLVAHAKQHGTAIVWDNDDDWGSIPRGTVAYKKHGGTHWERRRTAMQRIFRDVDLLTAPNATLVERLASLGGQRTTVIENYPPDQFLRTDQRPHDGVVIGWIAALEHQLDAERLPVRDALRRLLDERPDVRVMTFGMKLGLPSGRCSNIDVVPLLALTQEATAFDIGIAPLVDHPINQARSNIKLKEYAAAGLPWLASPIGPYAGMGEKQGGRLVPDDDWYPALLRLVDKERERRKLAKRAAKWIEGETLERNAGHWETAFAEAVERSRARSR